MIQETAKLLGYEKAVFLDDAVRDPDVVGKCCDYESFLGQYDTAVAALGDNNMRLHWTEKLMEAGYDVPAIIHPSAVVSPSASVGKGSFIMQRAIVNTHTVVEHGVLINSGAVVDHDSYVERGAHIGLGSVVKANCRIASKVKVEAGEVIFSTRRKIDGVEDRNLEDAIYAFGFGNRCSYVKPFGAGHINETYAVYMPGQEGDELSYVLQRVNSNVFKDPAGVMDNIFGVTEYLRNVIRREGGDPDRETLSYIKTKSGCNYFEDSEGEPWRCYNFIPDSVCYQLVEEPEQFYQSGSSFGHFLKQLCDYVRSVPVEELTFIRQAFTTNYALFEAGLNSPRTTFARYLLAANGGQVFSQNEQKTASLLCNAAIEARVLGLPEPAMSITGSGAHGIIATMPLYAAYKVNGYTEEALLRATALSYLVCMYIKEYSGKLSAFCGCAIAAGTGMACGLVFLRGGSVDQMHCTINNLAGSITGMICDGGNQGCTMKGVVAVDAAWQAVDMAMKNIYIDSIHGINAATPEETMRNMGRIASPGMVGTEKTILDILQEKRSRKEEKTQ